MMPLWTQTDPDDADVDLIFSEGECHGAGRRGRYLGIMDGSYWWYRRNCVTERRRGWEMRRKWQDGAGII